MLKLWLNFWASRGLMGINYHGWLPLVTMLNPSSLWFEPLWLTTRWGCASSGALVIGIWFLSNSHSSTFCLKRSVIDGPPKDTYRFPMNYCNTLVLSCLIKSALKPLDRLVIYSDPWPLVSWLWHETSYCIEAVTSSVKASYYSKICQPLGSNATEIYVRANPLMA